MDVVEEKISQLDSTSKKMFSSLKNKIIEENRLLNVDLLEFCSKRSNIQNLYINTSKTEMNADKSNKNENKVVSEHTKESNNAQKDSIVNVKIPRKKEKSQNYGRIKSLLDIDKLENEFKSKNYAEIIKEFENCFDKYPNSKISTQHLNFLTHALYKKVCF